MSLGWYVITSTTTIRPPVAPTAVATDATAEEKKDYQRQLDDYRDDLQRYVYLREARRLPWQASEDPALGGAYVTAFDRKAGWTNFGIDVPASFFLVFEPARKLILPALATFHAKGSTAVGLLLLVWTLVVWSIFGAAICRIAAVQVARNGNVGLIESLRFVGARYVSFFTSPVLPFLGVILIVVSCIVGAFLLRIPVVNIAIGAVWILPILAGFVMVAALMGLAFGWPLMYAAIAAEATESFDALSRAFSYVLGRPWNYFFYAVCAALYGGVVMVFAVAFTHALVHMSQYATSWGYPETSSLYAFVPEAPGWRAAFGPALVEDSSLISPPTGTVHFSALAVGFWTHLLFVGLVGFTFSYFWSQVTAIYFLLRCDVDETEMDEVYLEEEDDEPFPTAMPTVAPPKGGPASPTGPGPDAGGSSSLPIVQP
jgi:hypothetical protein